MDIVPAVFVTLANLQKERAYQNKVDLYSELHRLLKIIVSHKAIMLCFAATKKVLALL